MKTVSVALEAHLAGSAHTMATCWRVARIDDRVFGFTSHDEDLEIDGVVYAAATGIDRSAIEGREGLAVENADVSGFLDADVITEDDLRAGLWDHAAIRVFEVNWADLSMGQLKQMRGWLGEVTLNDGQYKVELRGLMTALNAGLGEPYTPGCRARLGDARCQKDLTDYTAAGTVFGVTDDRQFTTDLPSTTVRLTPSTTGAPPAGYFDAGLLTWTSGLNAGLGAEVKLYAVGGEVQLQLPMGYPVQVGDTFSVESGCLKDRDTCFAKFGNVVNFRGHPDLPGVDKVIRVGGQ